MVTSTKDSVVFKRALLYFGTAGSAAATTVGYIASGEAIEVAIEPEMGVARAEGTELPIIAKRIHRTITVSGRFMQHDTDLFELIFGATAAGNVVTLSGDVGDTPTFSLKIVGTAEDGDEITWVLPYCVSFSSPTISYVSTEVTQVDFNFQVIEGSAADATVTNGYTSAATLSTGALTRTASQGYHTVTSEDGSADTLTSITGASLTNAETLVLQITSETAAITLTHLGGTLALTGEVDWVMDSAQDWILLTYGSSGTVWTETARYDAP